MTSFSQRDLRWSTQQLGTCDLTIGRAGCLISSVAAMLVDFGCPTDPGRLNAWLKDHRGYVRGCHFVYDSVRGLGANLSAIIRCPTTPAPMDKLRAALDADCGVIAKIDAIPGGKVDQHWVQLLTVIDDDCTVMDPWQPPGREVISLIDHYGLPGWDAARAILQAVIYTPNHDRVIAWHYSEPRDMEAQGGHNVMVEQS